MPMTSDIDYMRRCFALAERGHFTARPNPVVGCVLVKDGRVVGEGWHARTGQPHAEALALDQAGAAARGATAYVSLEPCSHYGRTPPCADALIDSGVARVVYGMQDPNPLVSGRGLDRLRQAGIVVVGPLLPEEAERLNPGFCKRMRHGLPWVRCKVAMSLDGRIALHNGASKWITGSDARADVQRWRARSCAVLSGIGTVLQDDPGLNVRIEDFAGIQPLRVIADSRLRLPPTAALLRQSGTVVLACAREDAAVRARLEAVDGAAPLIVQALAADSGRVDLPALLRYLAQEHHCNEVLLESGPTLASAMLQAGLVDEVLAYVAPSLLGSSALPVFELPAIERLADRVQLQFLDVAMVGKDCRIRSLVLRGD